MNQIVIENTTVIQTMAPCEVANQVDIVVEGGKIIDVGVNAAGGYPLAKRFDGSGKIVIPGMVCAHHHYYSGLSRGMLVKAGKQTDFIEVLKQWWWRLDRALDEEACFYSSLICSIDAIASGTTSCIDHHASPSYISGSLETIASGMRSVGIRGLTCYETTDRNRGLAELKEGVAENIAFAKSIDQKKKQGELPLVEAMIGGHAPFTISDEGLSLMAAASSETGRGIHLHVAEDAYDAVWSHHRYGTDIADRLEKFGLLSPKSLLVHGLYLSRHEIDLINSHRVFVAHNSRSNMNNRVGYCSLLQHIDNLVLGTDGCGSNMFEEIKMAFFKHRDQGGTWWPADFLNVLARGNEILELYFGKRFGRIEAGYSADLTILDYHSPTPLVADNVGSHVVWGMSSNAVDSVMVDGRLVMEHRCFPFDVAQIYAKAAEVAKRVWKRVDEIMP